MAVGDWATAANSLPSQALLWIDERLRLVSESLSRAPEVVLVLDASVELRLPQEVHTVAKAAADFHGEELQMLILALREVDGSGKLVESRRHPHAQLLQLESLLRNLIGSYRWLFPLHDFAISEAISAFELMMGTRDGRQMLDEVCAGGEWEVGEWPPWRQRAWLALSYVRILAPAEGGKYLTTLRRHYGQAIQFFLLCDYFYVQMLWLLSVPAVCLLALRVEPNVATRESFFREEHLKWEVGKLVVIVWGVVAAVTSWHIYASTLNKDENDYRLVREWEMKQWHPSRPSRVHSWRLAYKFGETWDQCLVRWLKLFLLALPAFGLLLCLGLTIIVCITIVILYAIYVWGDCLHLGCRSPQDKHGFEGWLVEVSCDVLLALGFELMFAVDGLLAQWIADLRNYKYKEDHQYCKRVVRLSLSFIERLGFISCIAFLFVPQWSEPAGREAAWAYDEGGCHEFGFGLLSCLRLRLPVEQRRYVFEALMKGPFCVAPFVSIAMKSIVPAVARKLTEYLEAVRSSCARPALWLLRICALIFSYEMDAVGGIRYIWRGKPQVLHDTAAPAPASAKSLGDGQLGVQTPREKVEDALMQNFRREFDPEDDLLEVQMSYLWVLFLMPIKPEGVLFTLVARILDINFDISKLLFVRRRPFPRQDKVMRQVLTAFLISAAVGSIGFSAGLSLITYNDDLWSWGHRSLLVVLMLVWLGLSILVMFVYNLFGRRFRRYRRMSNMLPPPCESESIRPIDIGWHHHYDGLQSPQRREII